MLSKEFLAFVLAMGLIVSIGIVLGQENIGYIGGLGATGEMGFYTPITGEITGAAGGYTLDNFPKGQSFGDITVIPYARPFDRYKIVYVASPPDAGAVIECYYGINLVGYIEFISDESFEGEYYRDHGFGIYQNDVGVVEYVEVIFPESQFDEILSILRNENTLAIWNSEVGYGIVTTSTQQVGG